MPKEAKEVFGSITIDTIFKIVFTKEENKNLLLFLLNSCLKEVLKEPITDVTLIQTVEPPKNKNGRFTVFDVQCKTADNTRFIVEMQVGEQEYFIKRTFFSICRATSNLAKKGKMKVDGKTIPYDYNIPVVYSLSFLSFEVDFGKGCDELIQYISAHNDLHPEVCYDIMHMVYVMLPRFRKKWEDCEDAFEQLVFLFKNISTLSKMPGGYKDKAIKEILMAARISNLTEEELMEYERQKKYLSDYYAALAFANKKGIAVGDAIGEKRGEKRVLDLVAKGYSYSQIKKILKEDKKVAHTSIRG